MSDKLREALARAFGALVMFGHHEPGCKVCETYRPRDCGCGFNAAMNEAEAVLTEAKWQEGEPRGGSMCVSSFGQIPDELKPPPTPDLPVSSQPQIETNPDNINAGIKRMQEMTEKAHGPVSERFMRHYYGASKGEVPPSLPVSSQPSEPTLKTKYDNLKVLADTYEAMINEIQGICLDAGLEPEDYPKLVDAVRAMGDGHSRFSFSSSSSGAASDLVDEILSELSRGGKPFGDKEMIELALQKGRTAEKERCAKLVHDRLGPYLNTMVADLDIQGKGEYLRQLFGRFEAEVRQEAREK